MREYIFSVKILLVLTRVLKMRSLLLGCILLANYHLTVPYEVENRINVDKLQAEKCNKLKRAEINTKFVDPKCELRPRVLPLVSSHGVLASPAMVMVQRCEGWCAQSGRACVPLETKTIKIPASYGQTFSSKTTCRIFEITEHATCGCESPAGSAVGAKKQMETRMRPALVKCKDRRRRRGQCELLQGGRWSDADCMCQSW